MLLRGWAEHLPVTELKYLRFTEFLFSRVWFLVLEQPKAPGTETACKCGEVADVLLEKALQSPGSAGACSKLCREWN